MTIVTHAYARAGLVGNPSDGYYGKTIAFVIRQFKATVTLTESDKFEILPDETDFARYDSVTAFMRDVKLHGYYGGMRLMKAIVKKFYDYAAAHHAQLPLDKNFQLKFDTDVPRLVGMSGSSAIMCATLRALMKFYNVEIPLHIMPGVILSAEKEELNISAGLQDRVIQSYEGMVYMDFQKELLQKQGYGHYIPLKPTKMPPLYVSFDPNRAEVSDVTHRNLRALFEQGDSTVVSAMQKYRDLTDRGHAALMTGDWDALHQITNENFDLRKTFMPIAMENQRMVDVARSTGASAKFAGSGGAICGVYHSEEQFEQLTAALSKIGCTTIKPNIFG